jgi:hypothetical protein
MHPTKIGILQRFVSNIESRHLLRNDFAFRIFTVTMRLVDPSDAATAARRHRPLSSLASASKLFVTGATVGPVVDSIHNRCLLQYDYAPINLEPFFHSSWIIPPLLGASYVILGMIVPRAVQRLFPKSSSAQKYAETEEEPRLGVRAGQAVVSTVLIIVLSLYLETTRTGGDGVSDPTILGLIPSNSFTNIMILSLAALGQWSWLDRTWTSLVSAVLAALLGPLCELPLCAHGFWHYLPQACDYFPLEALLEAGLHNNDEAAGIASTGGAVDFVSDFVLGEDYDPRDLGLASITGPCYFAVTTDAIALGRWFDAQQLPPPPSSSSSATVDAN